MRNGNRFNRSVHHKNTFTGQYILFRSFSRIQYEIGLVKTLLSSSYWWCVQKKPNTDHNLIKKYYKKLSTNWERRGSSKGIPIMFILTEKQYQCQSGTCSFNDHMSMELCPQEGNRLRVSINRLYCDAILSVWLKTKATVCLFFHVFIQEQVHTTELIEFVHLNFGISTKK